MVFLPVGCNSPTYHVKRLAPLKYSIKAEVAEVSDDDAVKLAHGRAAELCPQGYQVLGETGDLTTTALGRSKADTYTLIVECNPPPVR